jgi:hypothetical protein
LKVNLSMSINQTNIAIPISQVACSRAMVDIQAMYNCSTFGVMASDGDGV